MVNPYGEQAHACLFTPRESEPIVPLAPPTSDGSLVATCRDDVDSFAGCRVSILVVMDRWSRHVIGIPGCSVFPDVSILVVMDRWSRQQDSSICFRVDVKVSILVVMDRWSRHVESFFQHVSRVMFQSLL